MVAVSKIAVPLGSTAPNTVPPDLYQALTDIHIAIHNLATLLQAAIPVMMSPNGHYWTAAIDNAGAVTWTDVGTTHP